MPTFDLISDIHIDYWVKIDSNLAKYEKKMDAFIEAVVPKQPSSTLAIAGDIGDNNKHNAFFLKKLSTYYSNILIVFGNHDFYLVSKSRQRQYNRSSNRRIQEMKDLLADIPHIHFLEGSTIEIEGIRYGGTSGWYDFSFGRSLGFTNEQIYQRWKEIFSDYKYIRGIYFHPLELFEEEMKKMKQIVSHTDIMITHVAPESSHFNGEQQKSIDSSFYMFDGEALLREGKPSIWCFGHSHQFCDFTSEGTRFLSHTLGYPSERDKRPFPFAQIQI